VEWYPTCGAFSRPGGPLNDAPSPGDFLVHARI